MADKAISELVSAEQITATDMFVLEQNGTAKKLTGQVLLNWLTAAADGHGGIQSIVKRSTSGLADTYRITMADTTVFDFVVTNGRGISSLQKTGTSGLVDTYTFTYNDGTKDTFTVTNGEKGDKGDNAYIWVKYASREPTASSNSLGDLPDDWMGVYFGTASTAPTNWQSYKWYRIRGEKGDTGEPATLVSAEITYQTSDSGTIIPSGSWSTSVPPVTPGRHLWTRQVLQFNSGDPITSYSVSRFGIDGTGAVSTVAGVAPDETGNVPLDAASVKALPLGGGTMEGAINMNGQKLSGLNTPTQNDEAATKGYVDNYKPNLSGYATETYVNNAVKEAAPYNYAHNSDFTQFIAQAGIGGNHGTQAYAGDRWILDSGTVTGDAREDGNGYTNITLNGTIRQIVNNAPDVGTVAIEMISGTAEISYVDGEITITSNGGVIKNVRLFKGNYSADNRPVYQPKGYSAELRECMRYFRPLFSGESYSYAYTGQAYSATDAFVPVPLEIPMRVVPSIHISGNISNFGLTNANASIKEATIIEINRELPTVIILHIKASGLVAGDATCFSSRTSGPNIYLSADL